MTPRIVVAASVFPRNRGTAPNPSRLGDLTREGGASTFIRLFTSRHVADLRLLFGLVLFLLFTAVPTIVLLHTKNENSLVGSPALAAGITAIALGALAHIYQSGSIRLGIVDLFSCEIITICRVICVVDSAHGFLSLHDTPPLTARRFTSEENYSPIFNSNARDLENLEARIVERVTEFYTYLKTMRDYLRKLADIEHPKKSVDEWQLSVRNTIYMLFLMLESARKAIDQMVEYHPERALYNAEILLSEIVVYKFLWEKFSKEALKNPQYDARFRRLDLRKNDYRPIVKELNRLAAADRAGEAKHEREAWCKVAALLNELNRYCQNLDEVCRNIDQTARPRASLVSLK